MKITTTDSNVTEFRNLIIEGVEAWVKAGDILVDLLDNHGLTYEQIADKCDGITPDIIKRFEQIGRRQIYPRLLVNTSAGARKLMSMPYSQQVKYASEPLPLLIRKENSYDEMLVKVQDLTNEQIRQVFQKDGIRDLGAQRAYLEDIERSSREVEVVDLSEWDQPWIVKNGRVTFRKPCAMGRKELLSILSEMER